MILEIEWEEDEIGEGGGGNEDQVGGGGEEGAMKVEWEEVVVVGKDEREWR